MLELNIDSLPENAKKELLDFYEFLIKKYGKSNNKQNRKPLSKFAGILDNLPIDPLEYQNRIRKEWEKNNKSEQ